MQPTGAERHVGTGTRFSPLHHGLLCAWHPETHAKKPQSDASDAVYFKSVTVKLNSHVASFWSQVGKVFPTVWQIWVVSHTTRPLWIWSSLNGHIDTHTCIAVTHCGSRLVQLLLGSDINTEQIGGDLQPLLFDLSSSCHISWHCPPATPRGAGRTGMASTCLPGLFSVFFPFQLIPLCPLHGFSSANYKSSPTPSDSPDSRDLQSTSLSSSERSDTTSACDVSLALLF